MTTIGLICEYNPFHNGHLYHIEKIKEKYPNSLLILVLNGYFLERGNISIQNKKVKTEISLIEGIDIVVELPAFFGTQSADQFANAAVTLLNSLHVEKIIFGSEENDLDKLKKIAKTEISAKDSDEVKQLLNAGLNYPTALAKILDCNFSFKPNDLLGISYLKSIYENNYNIECITIKRTNEYHDTLEDAKIISGDNIRQKIIEKQSIQFYLPTISFQNISQIDENILFNLLKYKIFDSNNLSDYLDVDEGLEYKLKKEINNSSNINELIKNCKSKRYTYNKLSRMLVHILLSITKKDASITKLTYIKILGFNKLGQKYLKSIKKELLLPTKIDYDSPIYRTEIQASLIYDIITHENNYQFELKNKPIIK